MDKVARIFVRNGTLTFEADVPYDQQVLFESADRYAKQQGSIRLDLDGVQWTVRAPTHPASRCGHCGVRVPELMYVDQRRRFCPRCARELCLVPHLHRGRAVGRKSTRRKDGPPLPRGVALRDGA